MSLIGLGRSARGALLCLFALLASCDANRTGPSEPNVDVPAVPGNLVLSDVVADFGAGRSAAVISWNDVDNEATFELERQALLSEDAFTQVATLNADTTEYRDQAVVLGRPYTYRVRSVNDAGASAYSSELNATPLLPGATVLFDGSGLSAWEPEEADGELWPVEDRAATVVPGENVGDNDLRTRETYRDLRLHVEFNVPESPDDAEEQERGNSGVYLQGRYEIQVLDSYGRTLEGEDDVGAVYGVSDASTNVSLPAGEWQRYDIVFRAPRYEGETKVEDARVSVRLNGTLIQDDVQIPGPTRLGNAEDSEVGPVVLQAHRDLVRFRNLWVERRD